MIFAAGILFLDPDGKALFLKRGPGSDHPGEWCFPGGHIEDGESAEAAAEREAIEELGLLPEGKRALWTRQVTNDLGPDGVTPLEPVDYVTFAQQVLEQFSPTTNGEHTGWAWAAVDEPPEPLHPGCRVALARLSMNELGVARAIAAGDLASPQHYENMWLFAIRITGTETAYRKRAEEYVYRRPENYLTDEFLARCNGLQVILEHPPGDMLDSNEYGKRVVGSVFLPYLKGDEVWAVVKIYDDITAKMMAEGKLSTSPAVFFRDLTVNEKIELDNGSKVLIEGNPSLLDHIAICALGVWDKGGPPAGIDAGNHGAVNMTEEEKAAAEEKARKDAEEMEKADRAKKDAEAGEKLDKILAGLDSMGKRMDTVEAKCDSVMMSDKARKDAAEEEERRSKMSEEERAADKAKKDAEEDRKREEDRARDDKAKKDAEEEEERKERERIKADAAETKSRIEALERDRNRPDEERTLFASAQARADSIAQAFGDAAPRPLSGETLLDYRKRLVKKFQAHSPAWKAVDLGKVDGTVLEVAETGIYADAMTAARSPTDVPFGKLREVRRQVDGREIREFVGQNTFIAQFARPKRVVTNIGVAKGA